MRPKLFAGILFAFALFGLGFAVNQASAQRESESASNEMTSSVERAFQSATWTVRVRWDNGVEGSFQVSFNSDGTWVGGGHQGRWFQNGNRAVFSFQDVSPVWSLDYSIVVGANGTTFDGIQGYDHNSGHPKGICSAVRASSFISSAAKLTADKGAATGSDQ